MPLCLQMTNAGNLESEAELDVVQNTQYLKDWGFHCKSLSL